MTKWPVNYGRFVAYSLPEDNYRLWKSSIEASFYIKITGPDWRRPQSRQHKNRYLFSLLIVITHFNLPLGYAVAMAGMMVRALLSAALARVAPFWLNTLLVKGRQQDDFGFPRIWVFQFLMVQRKHGGGIRKNKPSNFAMYEEDKDLINRNNWAS